MALRREPTSRRGAADLAQRLERRARQRRALLAHDRRLHVADRGAAGERDHRDLLGRDEHVERVGDRDPAPGGHERLRLDGLVAVPGEQ
jgi:hypothetical protein